MDYFSWIGSPISPIEIVLQVDLLLFCVFSLGQNHPTTRLQWNKSKLFKCSVAAKVTSAHGDTSNVEQILKATPTLIYMWTAISRMFAWNKKNSNLQSTWWLAWITVPLSATTTKSVEEKTLRRTSMLVWNRRYRQPSFSYVFKIQREKIGIFVQHLLQTSLTMWTTILLSKNSTTRDCVIWWK